MLDHSRESLLHELEAAGAKIRANGKEILCAICGVSKPEGEFNKDRTRPTGRHPYCKSCRRGVTASYRKKKGTKFQKEYFRAYYNVNSDKLKARARKWVQDHPLETHERDAEYKRANKDKLRRYHATRKSRIAVTGNLAREADAFVREILGAKVMPCHWCGRDTTKGDREVDHIIPLSRGGLHFRDNLCCSCKPCNHSKGAKLPEEFVVYRKMRGLPVAC